MAKDKETIIMGGGCPEYNKEIVDYFKRKDIKEADKLLFETAKNNFEAGKEVQRKEDFEMFDRTMLEIEKGRYKHDKDFRFYNMWGEMKRKSQEMK